MHLNFVNLLHLSQHYAISSYQLASNYFKIRWFITSYLSKYDGLLQEHGLDAFTV